MNVAIGDVFRFALHQRLFLQEVINTFAARVVAVPANTTIEAWVDNWFNDATGYFNQPNKLRDRFRATQSIAVTYEKWSVQKVTLPVAGVIDVPITTNTAGGNLDTAETANTAACISRRGELAGRRQKGRIAVAGIGDVGMVAGKWDANTMGDLNLLGAELRGFHTRAAGDDIEMGYWSPEHQGTVGNPPILQVYPALFVKVVSTTARDTVRVQRSRTVGVGS